MYVPDTAWSVPTAKPLRNLPPKKTSFVVATISMEMAANDTIRAMTRLYRRPIQSANWAEASAPMTCLSHRRVSMTTCTMYTRMKDCYSRSHGCTRESGLPFCVQNPIAIIEGAKVLTELRDSQDITRCLIFKADEQDCPDGIETPSKGPRVLFDGLPFANLVVLLVGQMSQSLFHDFVANGLVDVMTRRSLNFALMSLHCVEGIKLPSLNMVVMTRVKL